MGRQKQQAMDAGVGAVLLGAVSTFGDWLWTHYIPDGAVVPGILHGVVVFLVIGLFLASRAVRSGGLPERARQLVWGLPVAGAVIAAAFYPIYGFLDAVGYGGYRGYLGSLLVTWVAMWGVIAWLHGRARPHSQGAGETASRAALAAVGSGLAFWAISDIWTKAQPGGPNYLWHFACWSFAFLPGFAALLLPIPGSPEPAADVD
ncbi:MAG: hypothetical protein AAGF23_04955 [Acidobacteriota bacterium]